MFTELMLGIVASVVASGVSKIKLPADLQGAAMPLATLESGLIVGNFSSPHAFTFTDGTVLPACSASRSALGALEAHEDMVQNKKGRWTDIKISFTLSEQCRLGLHEASKAKCDIVIVPRVVLEALEKSGRDTSVSKFRTIRMADRVKKIAFADKFCV